MIKDNVKLMSFESCLPEILGSTGPNIREIT